MPTLTAPEVSPVLPDDVDPVLCGVIGCRRLPVLGAVCRAHGDQLGQWLAEIGTDFAALELGPAGAVGSDDPNRGRRPTKVKSKGSPVNLDVLVLTDRRIAWLTDDDVDDLVDELGRDPLRPALEVLAWWAALVREARGLEQPRRRLPVDRWSLPPGPVCAACRHVSCVARRVPPGPGLMVPAVPTVEVERLLLTRHLEWCCRQAWAPAMWRSVRQLWAALKVARGDEAGRPVATCRRRPTLLDEACGGPVWSERGVGWCGRCSHVWTGRELLELTRKGVAA